jgi:hypothetical protein
MKSESGPVKQHHTLATGGSIPQGSGSSDRSEREAKSYSPSSHILEVNATNSTSDNGHVRIFNTKK